MAKHGPQKGTQLVQAIIQAAASVGEDGRGKDGLVGYLRNVAIAQPKAFVALLGRVLAYQDEDAAKPPEPVKYRSLQEVREDLAKRGIVIDHIYE